MPQWWRPWDLYCGFLKGSAHVPTWHLQTARAPFPSCAVKLMWACAFGLWNDTSAREHLIFQFKIHFLPLWAWANYYGKVMSSRQLLQLLCGRGCQAWVSSLCAAIHHDHIGLWALVPAGPLVPHFFFLLLLRPSAEVHCFCGEAFLSCLF